MWTLFASLSVFVATPSMLVKIVGVVNADTEGVRKWRNYFISPSYPYFLHAIQYIISTKLRAFLFSILKFISLLAHIDNNPVRALLTDWAINNVPWHRLIATDGGGIWIHINNNNARKGKMGKQWKENQFGNNCCVGLARFFRHPYVGNDLSQGIYYLHLEVKLFNNYSVDKTGKLKKAERVNWAEFCVFNNI